MKTKKTTLMQNSFVRVALATAALLLIPLVGMQLSSEWNWDVTDFIIIGALIFVTGLTIELVRGKVLNKTHRTAIIIAIVLAFLYIWAELAVGIFTNWGS